MPIVLLHFGRGSVKPASGSLEFALAPQIDGIAFAQRYTQVDAHFNGERPVGRLRGSGETAGAVGGGAPFGRAVLACS